MHYPEGKQIEYSVGIIKIIHKNTIFHSCSTSEGSSGNPIINRTTHKILGVHKGHNDYNNIVTLLKEAIEQFYVENVR